MQRLHFYNKVFSLITLWPCVTLHKNEFHALRNTDCKFGEKESTCRGSVRGMGRHPESRYMNQFQDRKSFISISPVSIHLL